MTDHIRERQLITLLAAILLLLFAFPYVQGALAGDVLLKLLECAIVITRGRRRKHRVETYDGRPVAWGFVVAIRVGPKTRRIPSDLFYRRL
jgi:hypothetical protein